MPEEHSNSDIPKFSFSSKNKMCVPAVSLCPEYFSLLMSNNV
jgi:hypothetical protein